MNTKNLISKIKSTTNETLHQLRNNKALCAATMFLFSVTPVFCASPTISSIVIKGINFVLAIVAVYGIYLLIPAIVGLVNIIKEAQESGGGPQGLSKAIVNILSGAVCIALPTILIGFGITNDFITALFNGGVSL